jgi:hypothetical protein
MKMIDKAVSSYAQGIFDALPDNVKPLINQANYDLYFGPVDEGFELYEDGDTYPGFSKALDLISEALPNIHDVYFDECFGEIVECEPEAYFDDEFQEWIEPDQYYLIESTDILKALLGKELYQYI